MIDDKTKHFYTAKNIWKRYKAFFWKAFDAKKHDDTLLLKSSQKQEKDKALEDCKFFVKRSYDKRYCAFYCIDTETAKNKTIEERKKELKEIYDDAVNRGINKIKISLDSHGGPEDDLALEFDIDDIKYLLEGLLDDNKNDTKVLFVNSACYSSDINHKYNVDTEKMMLEASKKYPNITFIYEDHYDDNSFHYTLERYYSNTHFTLRYFLIKNGTITEINKKTKEEIMGGSYKNGKQYNKPASIGFKALILLLIIGGIREIIKCCKNPRKYCCERPRNYINNRRLRDNNTEIELRNRPHIENNDISSENLQNTDTNIYNSLNNANKRNININNNINNNIINIQNDKKEQTQNISKG